MELLNDLSPLVRMFWYVAIPTSIVFLIQTIMTFMGADAHDGASADFDSNLTGTEAPFQLFSLRNLINFLLGFSWAGIALYQSIASAPLLILVALAVGTLFVFMFFVIIRQIQKLAEDNSFKITNTLHKTAEVYLPIPEMKTGKGKILVSVNGSVHELEAMTEKGRIAAGAVVKIINIEHGNVLLVETI